MKWISLLIIVALIVGIFLLKKSGRISPKDAVACLMNGALVIDVRSPGEYQEDHLPSAINIPLGEIETALPQRVKDKNQILLLHCQSGLRSGVAVQKLHVMGYAKVFNLGSLARAREIIGNVGDH